MITEHLSIEDCEKVKEIVKKHGIGEFDAFVRFWGRGQSIQIDGDLTLKECLCLSEIAEFLNCVEVVP